MPLGRRFGPASSGSRLAVALFATLLFTPLIPQAASAGPPYVTDDPEPAAPGRWEVYLFGAAGGVRGAWDGEAGLDVNYGVAEDVQVTAAFTLDAAHRSGSGTRSGAGDVEFGVKYRFVHSEAEGFEMSLFPQVTLPTARRGFGTGRVSILLPIWAQKDFGAWSLFGGGGYTINPGAANRNFWQGGLALTRTLSDRLSVGGEATLEGPEERGGHSTAGLDVGAVYKLAGPYSLLASGGPVHEHHGETGWRAYAALGISF